MEAFVTVSTFSVCFVGMLHEGLVTGLPTLGAERTARHRWRQRPARGRPVGVQGEQIQQGDQQGEAFWWGKIRYEVFTLRLLLWGDNFFILQQGG